MAPWLTTHLSNKSPELPFAIMCISVGLAGLMSLILPETKGLPTRDTFEDLQSQCEDVNQTNVTDLKFDSVHLLELDRETVV